MSEAPAPEARGQFAPRLGTPDVKPELSQAERSQTARTQAVRSAAARELGPQRSGQVPGQQFPLQQAPVQQASGQQGSGQQQAAGQSSGPPGAAQLMSELKVSGHLMTLEDGLYCIVQTPAKGAEPGSGLPGVRLSLPPGPASRPDSVTITGFRADGWLAASGDAALVRITRGPAQLLVTVYQMQGASEGAAPNLQVMRLLEGAGAPAVAEEATAATQRQTAVEAPLRRTAPRGPAVMEMVAHIQERGDMGAMLGDWLGDRGSRRWIEGFGLSPTHTISPKEIEYQGVLGQGWLSPWVEGGQFCGSRAMALPLLGLRVRLRGKAAETYDVTYSASFIDGTAVGPVTNGAACEADSLAAMEAFQIVLRPRGRAMPPAAPRAELPVTKAARGKPPRAGSPPPASPAASRTTAVKSKTPPAAKAVPARGKAAPPRKR